MTAEKEIQKKEVTEIEEGTHPKNKVLALLKRWVTSPGFVWFGTLYFFTMVGSMLIGVAIDGPKGVFTYGKHMIDFYVYYGLNNESTAHFWVQDNPWAFFLAPIFTMTIGLTLYILPWGGWAINGPRVNDPSGAFYGMFFKGPVPGAEIYFFGNPKFNIFFLLSVILPLAFTIGISVIYSLRSIRKPSVIWRALIYLIMSWFSAIYVAKAGGPLVFDWGGFWNSILFHRSFRFQGRVVNEFIIYNGTYHPGAVAVTAWLLTWIPTMIAALIYYVYNREYSVYPLIDAYNAIRSRFIEVPEELPWDEEPEEVAVSSTSSR